jgi:Spy/CpxP family protein refolding chaperone
MKSLLKLAISALALGLAAAPFARAQDNSITVPVTPAPVPAPETAPAKRAGKAAGKRVADRDKMLAEKLNLTDAQKQQLADLRKQQAEQLKSAKGDRAKMAELMKTAHDQVRAMLTPEQQATFDAMPAEGRASKGGKKAAKQP